MEKFLILTELGQGLYARWLFKRFIPTIGLIIWLALLFAMLIAALIVGAWYILFLVFIANGLAMGEALALTAAIAITSTGAIGLSIMLCVKHMKSRIPQSRSLKSTLTTRASSAVEAFLDGLLSDQRHSRT